MKRTELNALIAHELMGLEECVGYQPIWYQGNGAALVRDPKTCTHREGMCYSKVELNTFIGRLGGVPAYCNSSQAGLVLLTALRRKCHSVVLCGQNGNWTLQMYEFESTLSSGLVNVGGPVAASTPEMAIALTAADYLGIELSEQEITD